MYLLFVDFLFYFVFVTLDSIRLATDICGQDIDQMSLFIQCSNSNNSNDCMTLHLKMYAGLGF